MQQPPRTYADGTQVLWGQNVVTVIGAVRGTRRWYYFIQWPENGNPRFRYVREDHLAPYDPPQPPLGE
ncbi:hypothetical protein HYALB_00001365 [Hymenoscyphus albidus]|uniref:Uncharacterized protein n=1 Tax=Hymenoscyphus albidus TaxID=595503 RepID=A0A9N9PYL9_9HELO|nr:hypothetical protein HYALB_00001365 [Hymenoscyphus albidus]